MALNTADHDAELIETLRGWVRERFPREEAEAAEEFVRQYYRWVPAQDLAGRAPEDLYGAAHAHWTLAERRDPGEVKLRVYNPAAKQDGWSSPHTIVEVVSDDMPFLVDSATMELSSQGFGLELLIHPVMRVRRDAHGRLLEVLAPQQSGPDALPESVMQAQVTRTVEREALERLHDGMERVLEEVRLAVSDWRAMLAKLRDARNALAAGGTQAAGSTSRDELVHFLDWLEEDNFTFLGYREYDFGMDDGAAILEARPGSGLGILRNMRGSGRTRLSERALGLVRHPDPLVLTKANSRATIHRPSYMDYIGVKVFDDDGQVVGERRFLGLYTRTAYKSPARDIPLLRRKIKSVLERAGLPPDSHDSKALQDILESYPRDSLFQMSTDDLFDVSTGILGLGERQRLRLFITRDPLERFAECLVCLPRDRFNTENRERVGAILLEAFDGQQLDFSVQTSESLVTRVHYIVRSAHGIPAGIDPGALERRLVEATRAWSDDLRAALIAAHGEEEGVRLHRRYARAFPPGYRSEWSARAAVDDIAQIERLPEAGGTIIDLYRPPSAGEGALRCKLFAEREISLSDVLPTFEHMGARVSDERPHRIARLDAEPAWIYDFGLRCHAADERARGLFQEVFLAVLAGELEDDGLGALVLAADLTGRQVELIRAITRYLRQGGIAFSDAYLQRTIVAHADVAALLVELFEARFDPEGRGPERAEALAQEIARVIDAVRSLDEDRILRSFLTVVMATLRTNYFLSTAGPRRCLALKLDPSQISLLPRPRPRFEIFVYSPRMEGVHLRGGKVARGGLRWSDRPEDYRTEILGLMKAQMVKNALIVPVGSKGGFVLKRPPKGDRDVLMHEAVACYETFLSGLLDLTDNLVEGEVVGPAQVIRYDDDDPYLVVAADKGTAAFSDIANAVSARYGFWLGDAFASGGSQGYDHKAMGITARGAWESVKRHFRELGRDIGQSAFTVVGIGDMSGDVFGNGMLLSPHIKLLAAFNHMHVFLDPDPDPVASLAERRRLFELERSSWADYDRSLISAGGGVYSRSAKRIDVSPQAAEALGIEPGERAPTEVISAILRAPVDLLWNGGVGTYVKASSESHAEVGDKANDALRVDGEELRCKVVGEGGNLGFTQLGRVEYASRGGLINTDAIDNVGGVNCSDHEVNIKILLDAVVARGGMDVEERNRLLHAMTDAVAEQVIYASYTQTQAMTLELAHAAGMADVHARLIRHLEQVAGLDRELEYLPDEEAIGERKADGEGLLAPELAVLMAYVKIHLYAELLESDLPDDEHLTGDLERYFPPPLGPGPAPQGDVQGPATASSAQQAAPGEAVIAEQMHAHRLRREIIATVVANQLVDRAGSTFTYRLTEETGAPPSRLARAFAVAREIFGMRSFWARVEELDNQIEAAVQTDMLNEARRVVERSARWLVRAYPAALDITEAVARFVPCATVLEQVLPAVLEGDDRETFESRVYALVEAGVPRELARAVARMSLLPPLFDCIEIAEQTGRELEIVVRAYFHLGFRLQLDWLRERIIELPRTNRWQALARAALRDDMMSVHRALVEQALEPAADPQDPQRSVEAWEEANAAGVERWLGILGDIKSSRSYDTTTLPVALREVRNLIHGSGRTAGESAALGR